MASLISLQLPHHCHRLCSQSDYGAKLYLLTSDTKKLEEKEHVKFSFSRKSLSRQSMFANIYSSRCCALSSRISASLSGQSDTENGVLVAEHNTHSVDFNRVDCLVWILHESARSFSLAVESLELPGCGAELAMAWNGKDVHMWHKRIAYQVAVYALLTTAIEVETLLSLDRPNPSPIRDILVRKTKYVGECIKTQLDTQHSELVPWFRAVELPRMAGFFIPLLKKWSMDYAGSGVAGIIVAISCCAAVGKLGSERISCPLFTLSIEDTMLDLMNLSHGLVSLEKLYQLAAEGGFELDFLSHFGTRVLPCENMEATEFWIGLAQKKLSVAFQKENILSDITDADKIVQADSLATLGYFAYLGRRTRLYLSKMGINDLDELVKDFLCYLECGSLFIYPEISSISRYQLFMEVATDEIGWLDFYAAFPCISNKERKRGKQHAIQAEKEIILSTVFSVCYDAFSGFAHFSNSTQKHLDAKLLAFLIRSQSLLTICLEDYWAAYDKPGGMFVSGASDHTPVIKGTTRIHVSLEAQQKRTNLMDKECQQGNSQSGSQMNKGRGTAESDAVTHMEQVSTSKSNPLHESLIRKYSVKLVSTSSDVWMGTQLLFIDIMVSVQLLLKKFHGHKVCPRERKKMKRTLNDIASLIPVTILMLIPVSAVGHAAMLAAIKRYVPALIPSPYSSDRLDAVKQLKRAKKMEVQSWTNFDDPSSKVL